MERERLGSRLGFILLSAGCAIGCGNVWKFPWMCGQYGGGGFVLIYILCLLLRTVNDGIAICFCRRLCFLRSRLRKA